MRFLVLAGTKPAQTEAYATLGYVDRASTNCAISSLTCACETQLRRSMHVGGSYVYPDARHRSSLRVAHNKNGPMDAAARRAMMGNSFSTSRCRLRICALTVSFTFLNSRATSLWVSFHKIPLSSVRHAIKVLCDRGHITRLLHSVAYSPLATSVAPHRLCYISGAAPANRDASGEYSWTNTNTFCQNANCRRPGTTSFPICRNRFRRP